MACREDLRPCFIANWLQDLEQRLPVVLDELIQDRPPRRIGECLEQVTHRSPTIGKQ
jgi:hypothetical protein